MYYKVPVPIQYSTHYVYYLFPTFSCYTYTSFIYVSLEVIITVEPAQAIVRSRVPKCWYRSGSGSGKTGFINLINCAKYGLYPYAVLDLDPEPDQKRFQTGSGSTTLVPQPSFRIDVTRITCILTRKFLWIPCAYWLIRAHVFRFRWVAWKINISTWWPPASSTLMPWPSSLSSCPGNTIVHILIWNRCLEA